MPTPFDALPFEGLVQPQAPAQPEGVPTFSAPKTRQQEYADFVQAHPQVGHVPFEVWDQEARTLETAGKARMADARLAEMGYRPASVDQLALTSDMPGGMVTMPKDEALQNAKAYNQAVTQGLEATRLPQIGKAIGRTVGAGIDISLGANSDMMEQVLGKFGQETPRSAVGFIPGVGIPAMTGDIAARTFAETEDPVKALIAAGTNLGTFGLAKGVGSLTGGATEKFINRQAANAIRPGEAAISAEIARQAMTSPIPKVAQAVGTATGAMAGSVGGQVIEGVDPTSPEAIANTLVNAAVFAGPEAISAVKNRNGLNRRASEVLSEWQREAQFEREARDAGQAAEAASAARKMGQQTYGTQAEARQAAEFQRLIEESASIPDKNPEQWRKETFAQNIRDIRDITDPIARKVEAARVAKFWGESHDLGAIADAGERTAMMLYAAPPQTMSDLANYMRRGSILVSDALRLVDEKVGETGTSAAAVAQLQAQGHLPKFDYEWLQNTIGEGLERSLDNSYSAAYQQMVNRLAGEMVIASELAKQARGEQLTQQSIAGPQTSEKVIKDNNTMAAFMEALGKVPETFGLSETRDPVTKEISRQSLHEQIYDRLDHHEKNDNLYGTGETIKYAEMMTELIDNLTLGKTPEELAGLDWANVEAPVSRERRLAKTGGAKEERVMTFDPMSLGRLHDKNFEGKYKVKIYGRGNRSQNEVLLSETGLGDSRRVGQGVTESASGQENTMERLDPETAVPIEQISTEDVRGTTPLAKVDWGQGAERVRQFVLDTPADKLWDVLSPAFMQTGKLRVHGKTEERYKPVIKDFVDVLFGAGITKTGVNNPESPAARRILAAWGAKSDSRVLPVNQVLRQVRETISWSGKTIGDFTHQLIRQLVKHANVEVPTVEVMKPTLPQMGGKGMTVSRTSEEPVTMGGGVMDIYRTLRNMFIQRGYDLDEIKSRVAPIMGYFIRTQPDISVGMLSPEVSRLFGGLYSAMDQAQGRPSIGLAQYSAASTGDQRTYDAWRVVGDLTHEYVHHLVEIMRGGVPKPNVKSISDESLTAMWRVLNYAKTAKVDHRAAVLQWFFERIVPNEFHVIDGQRNRDIPALIAYGAERPEEFVAVLGQLLGPGMMMGRTGQKLNVDELLTFAPEEVAMFAKGLTRNLADSLDAIQQASSLPNIAGVVWAAGGSNKDLPELVRSYEQIFHSPQPQLGIAQLKNLVNGLEQGAGPLPPIEIHISQAQIEQILESRPELMAVKKQIRAASKAVQDELFGGTPEEAGKQYRDPLAEVQEATVLDMRESEGQMDLFPGPRSIRKATSPGLFYKALGLFQQSLDHLSRQGVPLMHDAIASIMQLIPDENRMALNQRAPFSHTNGKLNKGLPIFQMRKAKTMEDRQNATMVNKLFHWAQRNEMSPLQQNDKGQWFLREEVIQSGIGDPDGHVHPDVADTWLRSMEANQTSGQLLVDSRIDSLSYRTSLLLMKSYSNNLPWNVAYEATTRIVRGMVVGNQVLAQQGLNMLPNESAQLALSFLNDGMVQQVKDLNKLILERAPYFATEQRRGEHFVTSFDASGVRHFDSTKTKSGADKLIKELQAKGFKDVVHSTRDEKEEASKFDSPETIALKYEQLEIAHMDKWLSENPLGLDAQTLAIIRQYAPKPGEGVRETLEKRGTGKFLMKRKSVPSAIGLDYVTNMFESQNALASTIARRALQHKIELILSDARLAEQPVVAQHIRTNLQAMLVPSGRLEQSAKTFVSASYIAANVSSMIVNLADPITTLPVQLIRSGKGKQGISSAYANVSIGYKDALAFHTMSAAEIDKLALSGSLKTDKGVSPTRQEYKAMIFQKGLGLKVIDKGLMHDITESEDLRQASARMLGTNKYDASVADWALDPVYRLLRGAMVLPRLAHQLNNHVAMFAGMDQAYDAGMNVDEGYQHADIVRTQSMFAGGRTNAPGYIGKMGQLAPAGRVLHSMGQYSVGILGMWYNTTRDAIKMDPNIRPEDRQRAWKAWSALFISTVVLAGLRGLPGVAAFMAWAYKEGEHDLESKARLGLYELSGKVSDDTGVRQTLTEVALNGVPNQVFGVNIGPRVGNPDFLGVSSYDGFNIADASASFSLMKNWYDGLGYFISGQPQKAVTSLAPNALRRSVTMAMNKTQFGDYQFRNPNTNEPVYNPTTMDLVKYNMGFEPAGASESRKVRELVKRTTDEHKKKEERTITDVANQMNRGDNKPAIQWVKDQLAADPTIALGDPMHPVTRITDKAVRLKNIADPLAPVPLAASGQAQAIQKTFPSHVIQATKPLDLEKQKIRAESSVGGVQGDPARRLENAQIMEALMVKKGMTPAQAHQFMRVLGD